MQWISNLKRPRIKHQGARIIARYPATYICVSFPDRSSAAGPHNQSIIIKARIQNRLGSLAFDNSLAYAYCVAHTESMPETPGDWSLLRDFSGVSLRKNSTHFMPDFLCRILSIFVEFRRKVRTIPAPALALRRSCTPSFAKGVRRLCARCGGGA